MMREMLHHSLPYLELLDDTILHLHLDCLLWQAQPRVARIHLKSATALTRHLHVLCRKTDVKPSVIQYEIWI